jgi:hypothetical protein
LHDTKWWGDWLGKMWLLPNWGNYHKSRSKIKLSL